MSEVGPSKRTNISRVPFSTATASAPFHDPHSVPDTNVAPDGAIVGHPLDHSAGRAPGMVRSVIGLDSS